jgi:peptidyl-prolyl cis-trans isomerase B (cyclophilin B)
VLARLTGALAVLLLVPVLAACGGNSGSSSSSGPSCSYPSDSAAPAARQVTAPPSTATVHGTVPVTIQTSVGTLRGTLDASAAPCTVNSFVSLAGQHFFDNTPCHRLTTANSGIYVLQCGDPTGTGTGGPGYTIPDELNGHEHYSAGTLAMANSGHPNTGGSQFFAVYQLTHLNPASYTVFGHLDASSVKLLQKVAAKGTDNAFGPGDGHPNEKVTITKVTTG